MKKYNYYKDSGVEWIGEIPEHWIMTRMKFLAKICGGQDQKSVIDENGIYPIFGSGGEFGKTNKYLHEGPTVLLGRKGTIDKPRYVETPFWSVDTAFFTDIFKITNPRLFFYLCTTINFELYKYGSAIPSMSRETLNNIAFPIPKSLEEQTQIAKYLDQKTAQIDKLISDKQKLIELLNEERTAMINQAVTKGLNPNVPMKDSGVEWLGEIPEHWNKTKLFNLTSKIGDGLHGTPEYVEESEYHFINGNNIGPNKIRITEQTKKVSMREASKQSLKLGENTLLLSINGTIGNLAYYFGEKVMLGKSVAYINFSDEIFKTFLFYYLQSHVNTYYFSKELSGSTIKNLSLESIKNTPIAYPGKNEQKEIAQYLDVEQSRIYNLIGTIINEIDYLKEYKTALISEVVTGKVDVRGEVINNCHDEPVEALILNN